MEQVKILEASNVNLLEGYINTFLAKLDEHTDVVDVRIDTHAVPGSGTFILTNYICTIRYATYINESPEPEDYVPPDPTTNTVKAMKNGYPIDSYCLDEKYPINDNNTDYAMEPLE